MPGEQPLDLSTLSLPELEELYRRSEPTGVPSGIFHGRFLAWIDSARAKNPLVRPAQDLLFRRIPFGVDFDRGRWFFLGRRRLAAGSFEASVGPSRWRDARVVRLTYGVSRLPGPIKGLLYDELVPVTDELCLGLGGVDAPRGEGDNFFFELARHGGA